jgi:TonB-dependent starch-binding outer membrane protein SusC
MQEEIPKMKFNIKIIFQLILLFSFLLICKKGISETLSDDITISRKQANLSELFIEIHKQTGFFFYYNETDLEKAHKIDINVSHASLEFVLGICFKNQPLEFELKDHTIVVKAKKEIEVKSMDFHGEVLDEQGHAIVGATVMIEGGRSVITDKDGSFDFTELTGNITITITHVGYESKTIQVNNRSNLLIKLKQFVNKLDEIQIIAYGTTTRRFNTGDVSTVKAEVIEEQPVSNPLAALEGRVSGLVITQQTGVPGGAYTVQIRGQNSITNGNYPLYIVDGVPFPSTSLASIYTSGVIGYGSPFSNINPADIESVEILKDADATAIYGSRGANGVILITTKKGKSGKALINASVYFGGGKVTRTMDQLKTEPYLQMRRQAFSNDGANPDISNGDYDLLTWDTTRYTNWEKVLIGSTANILDAQASVSGGDKNTQFFIGGGYHQEGSVFSGSFVDKKPSFHFNIGYQSPDQNFNLNFSGSYVVDNNNLPAQDFTYQSLILAPDAPPVHDSAGKINWTPGFDNPFSYLQMTYNSNTTNLIGNLVLSYMILPGLQLKANLGFSNMQMNETQLSPLSSINPIYNYISGSSFFANGSLKTWIAEPQIIYTKTYNSGKLNIILGSTFQEDIRNGQTIYATGFPSDALLENMAAASSINVFSQSYSQYKYNGFFGRINYNWNDKYVFNLTGRRDGSSRFGPGKQFANFGAIGVAYIFSSEKWVQKNLGFLSFGKLRGSYGITGNDQIGDYQFYSTYAPTFYPYNGNSGLMPNNLYNQNYGWETNTKWEAGIELGFFKDHLFANFSFFHNRSSNQLVGYPLPTITGFTYIQSNLPAIVQNTGLEIELSSVNVKTGFFSWKTSFNLSIPRNKLIAYPNLSSSSYSNIYIVGKSLQTAKLFHFLGVDNKTGINNFEDVNGDGQITYPEDLTSYKAREQQYYGGIQNVFQYKNWKLDFFFQFVKQTGYNYLNGYYTTPGMTGNQPTIVMNRWQKPGDQTNIQQFTQTYGDVANAYFNDVTSDNIISNASYIRLKNISISYSFGAAGQTKGVFENCRVFILGQNLLTITNYLGMDPENLSITNLPPLKILTAGVQFTF